LLYFATYLFTFLHITNAAIHIPGVTPLTPQQRYQIIATKSKAFTTTTTITTLPTTFNAHTKWPGCISPVPDQGTCGSCWAVSSASVMSDRLCIERRDVLHLKNTTNIQLSALQITSCDSTGGFFAPNWLKNKGCQGGAPWAAFEYGEKTKVGGMVPDSCFPYLKSNNGPIETCTDEPCLKFQATPICPDKESATTTTTTPATTTTTTTAKESTKTTATTTTTNAMCADGSGTWSSQAVPLKKGQGSYVIQLTQPMMQEIYHYGPIVATMVVYSDLLNFTGDGVYQQNSSDAIGAHAVSITGWGVWIDPTNATKTIPYWNVRNSWTTKWGNEGYFKIERGDDVCACDICNMCTAGLFYGNHSDLSIPIRRRTKKEDTDIPVPSSPSSMQSEYSVTVVNRAMGKDSGSIISSINKTSSFVDNFNAAWLPLPKNKGGGLFIRVTDTNIDTDANQPVPPLKTPFGNLGAGCTATTPSSTQSHSKIAFVSALDETGLLFEHVNASSLVVNIAPSLDPRATYRTLTNTSYLTYQCNVKYTNNETTDRTKDKTKNRTTDRVKYINNETTDRTTDRTLYRKTFLASTTTPNDVTSWQDQNTPMFPGRSQDCGTCVWFPEDNDSTTTSIPPAYALVTVGGLRGGNITLSKSIDGLKTWKNLGPFLSTRQNEWDDRTLSSSACPVQLSNGNWLVLYNVDNKWPVEDPLPIPKYGRCALGWAVVDGKNLTHVLARSKVPLIYAKEPYDEGGEHGSVYTDGVRALGGDRFVVYVGGNDEVVEAVEIYVSVPDDI
jgi:cathepsin B